MVLLPRSWWLIGLGGLLSAWAVVHPPLITGVVLLDIGIGVLILVDVLSLPRSHAFRARRQHEHVLSLGARNRITLVLEHELNSPRYGRLRDEPPPDAEWDAREFPIRLTPESPVSETYYLTPLYRGEARFEDIFLRVEGRLRLVAQTYRLPARESVPVYPNLLQMREYDLLRHRGLLRQMGFRQYRLRGQGTEFESLREYTPDDEFRKIDWNATARRGKPIVRDYQVERSQNIVLLLDAGRNMLAEVEGMRKFDTVLNCALMLAYVATQMDDKVGAMVFADEIDQFIPPQRGRAQVAHLTQRLHAVQPRLVEPDYLYAVTYLARRWRKRSLMVFFTDLIDPDSSRMLLHAVSTLRKQHLCLVVTVADPRLRTWSHEIPESPHSLYRRAVVTQIMTDRLSAIRTLERMGVHAIDSVPETLVTDLVNYYMRVKARGSI